MPFNADIRAANIRIQLNRALVMECLRDVIGEERENWTAYEEWKFDCFVEYLEDNYSVFLSDNLHGKSYGFIDWFFENYNNYRYYNDIEELFIKENDE